MMGRVSRSLAFVLTVFLAGCATSYTTPGRGAEMQLFGAAKDQMSDSSVVQVIDRRPLATLPASIAFVRVQAPGYSSDNTQSWGRGAYSIITGRDIQHEDTVLAELAGKDAEGEGFRADQPAAAAGANALGLGTAPSRGGAARGHGADLHVGHFLSRAGCRRALECHHPWAVAEPGSACELHGIGGALDTRNGYVYGVAEATDIRINWPAPDQRRRRRSDAPARRG